MVQTVSVNVKGRLLNLDEPVVMGILNLTPDSFFEGSRISGRDEALTRAEQMVAEGATLLDLGAVSTRPGADEVSEQEEMDRLLPILEAVAGNYPEAVISVDTTRASVAAMAVAAGAGLINDASGLADPDMAAAVAQARVPYVLMHTRGTPRTMTQLSEYEDVMVEVKDFFLQKTALLSAAGVSDIILDPGLGFAKTAAHSYRLLANLEYFQWIGRPILIGLSRKRMVYQTLATTPELALNGTTALHMVALSRGAHILRTHDVRPAAEAIRLHRAVAEARLF